ncbi:MAG TPA: elongation factor EF-2 [Candidatus Methanoculleus thermohydrogenotrophicum]|jgi:elongation factor 2|nr:elongation factor EF-2 [Candidatus Methanoculleus thermohydrogenotrophicum]NLM81284.1 elongation factor EF-2 [Candidatus Methanoculleus thermohydrogenotrophicum]HOB18261.1 elongation factor EF-2 [Candidatus Methanoculleus thermohydrogenotrophicum]HPZ38399.1 elongation factor EF-2 [Candidatus Methanoculleus thermohydrogenotrophicum]HQC91534.1 elongation factor EF-2 [Candidatus Methanoculleus thermohydrogenotrophicum]
MTRRKKMVERVTALMDKPDHIRNIGIVAHIDHGKTTLSDNLLAGAGMISEELAGRQLFMDSDEEEQARGITIDASNVSMVHTYGGEEYLINMIDTPGHVDFGGDVTRAMRAVDGAVVVVDAVEGTMPQTETVLRQALKEGVRPVLFINKVDRLINELKVDEQEMQIRLARVIDKVNKLIKGMNEKMYNEGWKLDAAKGTVAFGSALYNWAVSVPYMKKSGVSFKEVFEKCNAGDMKWLARHSPLHAVLLDIVVKHLPNPVDAQKRRIGIIWRGDHESPEGKAMLACDPNGPVCMMVTDISFDPHAGEVATGRVFSGTLRRGTECYIMGAAKRANRLAQVGIFMGAERIEVDELAAGNIAAVTGLKDAIVGSTVSTLQDMVPFESLKHYSEPVMTVAVEAKSMKDLPKLVEVLRQVAKEDPTVQVSINEETGEHLISGMGELHLEIITGRIKRDKGVEIITSPPIVVYRETITGRAGPVEGKSPNRHNRFYLELEPLEPAVVKLIQEGEVSMTQQAVERRDILIEAGMDKEEAKNIRAIEGTNVFIDMTKGVQYLNETMELVLDGWREALRGGPLADEPVQNLKVRLVDVKLHEDAIHRGPAQVIPAVRSAVKAGMLMAGDSLLEPIQKIQITVPSEQMGAATSQIQGRRGQVFDMLSEGDTMTIVGKAPVAELFGFAGDLRSATEGRAIWSTEFAGFELVPSGIADEVVRGIRRRKGLKEQLPRPEDYLS